MGKDLSKLKATFLFCDGSSCKKAGGENCIRNVRAYLRNNQLIEEVHTIKTLCNGRCEDAPTLIVQEGNYWYKKVNGDTAVEIAKSHIENQEPNDDYLLFQPEYDKVASDNEKGAFKLKPFESKSDPELGDCLIMRGFSSDQYLHPLFVHLVENPEEAKIIYTDGREVLFSSVKAVRYTKKFELELDTEDDTLEFVMAALPKERADLIPFKISATEYFYKEDTDKVGLRFKNNKGATIAVIELGFADSQIWKYCTEVQLQNNQLEIVKV